MTQQENWSTYFTANPQEGTLKWLTRPREHFVNQQTWKSWNTRHAGNAAGCLSGTGYLYVCVNYRRYRVHRILFEMFRGPIPSGMFIDHIDRNRINNALANLRPATDSQNRMNSPKQKNNTSGHKGVSWNKNASKWVVRINVNGRDKYLGRFHELQEAVEAYAEAAHTHHGEFAQL